MAGVAGALRQGTSGWAASRLETILPGAHERGGSVCRSGAVSVACSFAAPVRPSENDPERRHVNQCFGSLGTGADLGVTIASTCWRKADLVLWSSRSMTDA